MNRLSFGVLAVLAAAAPAAADPATALQPACQSSDDISRMLSEKFDEVPAAHGLQANGQLLQVFASKDGTTWTIVATRPDGMSCIVALGQHWQALEDPTADPMA